MYNKLLYLIAVGTFTTGLQLVYITTNPIVSSAVRLTVCVPSATLVEFPTLADVKILPAKLYYRFYRTLRQNQHYQNR